MSAKSEWTKSNYGNLIIPLKNQKKFNVPKSDYQNEGKYPIVSQEKSFISGYTNDGNKVFRIKNDNYILFGDHTTIFKYLNFDFVVGADGAKIFKSKNEKIIKTKYLYYISMNNLIQSSGYNRHFKTLKEIEVKFPNCIKEQDKVVKILDQQQSLLDSYKEKLSLLEEQESYYQDELLSGRIRIKLNSESEKVAIEKGFVVNGELVEGKEKEFEEWLSVDFKDRIEFYLNEEWKYQLINGEKKRIPVDFNFIKIKTLYKVINGFAFKSSDMISPAKFPVIKMSNFKNKKVIIDEKTKWTNIEKRGVLIQKNDLLMGLSGSVGEFAVFDLDLQCQLNQRCVVIRGGNFYCIKNIILPNLIKKYAIENAVGGVVQNLSHKFIEEFEIPSLEDLLLISILIKKINQQKEQINKKIKLEEEKMDYLMDELLSGRIRVK